MWLNYDEVNKMNFGNVFIVMIIFFDNKGNVDF